ncbi:MAG: NUDIX hydrolase [Patescibacteria group bacterium]
MKTNCRVSGIVFKDIKVAVVRHENKMHGTYYLLPGGGLEHDETIEECAVREVKEETGLDVKATGLIYYEDVVSSYDHTLHLIFKCEIIGGNLEVLDPDKKVKEILFVNKTELNKLKFFPEKLKEKLFEEGDITTPISLGKTIYPK